MSDKILQIGRYTGTVVAGGGFAAVYHVPQSHLGHSAALKWARAPLDAMTVASLQHEFRVLSGFDHPQLTRALDFGWAEGRPYLVTDWIDGPGLWELSSTDSESLFTDVLRQVARVLLFIHQRGWVHGDLKPDNFRWGDPRGDGAQARAGGESSSLLHLLDFGLARLIGDCGRPRGAGTVGYMAPEFLNRLPADGRADWYSVGAILYEWVFGRRPFDTGEVADEVAGHLEQPPDFRLPAVRKVPDWAPDLIARLLAKRPDERAANVLALLDWMSGFDEELDPDVMLGAQLDVFRRSEDLRLDTYDESLIAQVAETQAAGAKGRWLVAGDGTSTARLVMGLRSHSVPASARADMCVEVAEPSSESINLGAPSLSTQDGSGLGRMIELRSGPPLQAGEVSSADREFVYGVNLLPWDVRRVEDYLRGLTGDAAFAETHARSVWQVTSGLPNGVSAFCDFAARNALWRRDEGEWILDETALEQWSVSSECRAVYTSILPELAADERDVCDWLAVGRSFGRADILAEVLPPPLEAGIPAIDRLITAGVVVCGNTAESAGFFDLRLRLTGLAESWRMQMSEARRRTLAGQLADLIKAHHGNGNPLVGEILAACCYDAGRYDRCVDHAIQAAHARLDDDRRKDAVHLINLARAAARQIEDPQVQARWLGRAQMAYGDYLKACGQVDEARRTYCQLLVLGRRFHDRQLLAETLKDLGDIYKTTRRFEKGVRVLLRARQLWEEIGNRVEVARTLNNLGNMYWVASDRTQARRYYEEGLAVAKELGADAVIALILSNLGVTYKGDHDFGRAEAYYRESLVVKERLNVPVETARTLNNLGVIAFDQGHLDEATQYLERAAGINHRAGAAAELLCNQGMLIYVALERGDLHMVIRESLSALQAAERIGDEATGAELCALLAEVYLRAGDFRLADVYLKEARVRAAGQKHADLNAQLGLVAAAHCWHLGLAEKAIALLDEIEPVLAGAEFPRLRLDGMVLRMRATVARNDAETIEKIWAEGQEYAQRVGAPHKAAQLAFARLPDDPALGFSISARKLVEDFLSGKPTWHWARAFHVWEARVLAVDGDLAEAERTVTKAVADLRRDGNWETLWRALTVYGQICLRQADYHPALTAFEEAARILHEIANTIEDPTSRSHYLSQSFAGELRNARGKILDLTR